MPSTSTPSKSIRPSTGSRQSRRHESWARRTPAGFEFSLKLFQKFTHPEMFHKATGADPLDLGSEGRGRVPCRHRSARTRREARSPSRAVPGKLQERAELPWLSRMAPRALRGLRLAVELRHRSWSDDPKDTLQLLGEHLAPPGRRSTSRSSGCRSGRTCCRTSKNGSTTCGCTAATPHSGGSTRNQRIATTTSIPPNELKPFAEAVEEASRGGQEGVSLREQSLLGEVGRQRRDPEAPAGAGRAGRVPRRNGGGVSGAEGAREDPFRLLLHLKPS